jgi:hypothetical protein
MALSNLTAFPNGISSYGIPVMGGGGIPATFGNVWFVDPTNGSDANKGTSANQALASIGKAHTLATTNNNDVIVLAAYAAHAQTEMLTISKNRLHFVSASARSGYGMGARTRVTMGVTTAATDIAVMKNTGVGNTFTGIKFDQGNTVDEALYAVAEGGEYAIYNSCEFYKSTDLDETAAAEVLNNGDSAQWRYCYFGSTANITAAAKIRPNMLLTATLAGKKCRDNIVSHCIFAGKAADTAQVKIYGANATDVERLFLVENCIFYNNQLAAGTPAHAVGFGAAQTQGSVILKNCTSVKHTVMAQASRNIYVDGAVPTFATTGVSVAS